MSEMRLPVAVLREDAENPRTITPEALDGLKLSAEEFGDLAGIVWNEQTGELVCGHQRMRALRDAGATEWTRKGAMGVVVHPKTGERFSVRVVSWDRERQRMANLVANSPLIAGEFTAAALEQIRNLEDQALAEALRLTDLERQLAEEFGDEDDAPAEGNTDPDSVPATPAEPVTKRGDIWILGDHRLMCGDSTDKADVARLMDGKTAALMATDPPYGVDFVAVKDGIPRKGFVDAQAHWGDIANDELKGGDLEGFIGNMLSAAEPHLRDGSAFYLWHPSGELNHMFRQALVAAKVLVHRQIIWKKPGFVLTRSGMYHWAHETCFYGWRRGHEPPWYGEKNQTSVWEVGRDDGKAVHPTQKPVELFEIPMRNHTQGGEICYEPFSGSGTQIIAGERLGRRVFAMELEPKYCDVAVARWEEFTGRKAIRADQPTPAPRAVRANGESDEELAF